MWSALKKNPKGVIIIKKWLAETFNEFWHSKFPYVLSQSE